MSLLKVNTRDISCNRNINRPAAIISVTILGVVGSIVFLLLPMLIGAFTEELSLTAKQVGWLGSADMAGMFVAAVVATSWIRSYNGRTVAMVACMVLVACHALSGFIPSFTSLLLVRIAAGFAGGSLMSIALTSLGDTRKPDRYFALFVSGQLTLGALGLWLFPDFLARFGLGGVFIALACVVLGTTVLIPFIPQQGRNIGQEASDAPKKRPNTQASHPARNRALLPGVMALLACFVFILGIMAVWAYLERMGNAAGMATSFIGSTLAMSLLAALFGSLLAAVLADRYGRVLPLIITVLLQALALLLLSGEVSRISFTAGVMLFAFAWNFPVAYQLAITVSVDVSGRLVVLFLSAVKLGYAAAPAIAAQLISQGRGFFPVMILGAVGFVASAVIFSLLAKKNEPVENESVENESELKT